MERWEEPGQLVKGGECRIGGQEGEQLALPGGEEEEGSRSFNASPIAITPITEADPSSSDSEDASDAVGGREAEPECAEDGDNGYNPEDVLEVNFAGDVDESYPDDAEEVGEEESWQD